MSQRRPEAAYFCTCRSVRGNAGKRCTIRWWRREERGSGRLGGAVRRSEREWRRRGAKGGDGRADVLTFCRPARRPTGAELAGTDEAKSALRGAYWHMRRCTLAANLPAPSARAWNGPCEENAGQANDGMKPARFAVLRLRPSWQYATAHHSRRILPGRTLYLHLCLRHGAGKNVWHLQERMALSRTYCTFRSGGAELLAIQALAV
jgi:hypothetical protein